MIKRTPQEIADFFQCYVAKDRYGRNWYIYSGKPEQSLNVDWWIYRGGTTMLLSKDLISDEDDIGWQDSLCEPRRACGASPEAGSEAVLRDLNKLIDKLVASRDGMMIGSETHRIAEHYGIKSQMQQLMEECAELSVEASHCIRGKGNITSLMGEIADIEIMIEQVKYLMGIDPAGLSRVKNDKIARQLRRIDDESMNEEEEE